jgi:hypothetical protein
MVQIYIIHKSMINLKFNWFDHVLDKTYDYIDSKRFCRPILINLITFLYSFILANK